ncbi:hypothetical protein BBJ28_00025967, partial [Nothophytophthora sp. Chile5]
IEIEAVEYVVATFENGRRMEARARADQSAPGLDDLAEASHEDPPRSTSEEQTPTRKKFTVSDDVVLLKAVNVVKPWEAPS